MKRRFLMRHGAGDRRRGGKGRDSADKNVAHIGLRKAGGDVDLLLRRLKADAAVPVDRAYAGGDVAADGYIARIKRVIGAFEQGLYRACPKCRVGLAYAGRDECCACYKEKSA